MEEEIRKCNECLKCQDCFEKEARIAAKKMADDGQVSLITAIKESKFPNDSIFQARVHELNASFMLGICIKLLQNKKAPDTLIRKVAEEHVKQAFEFAKIGSFYFVQEH